MFMTNRNANRRVIRLAGAALITALLLAAAEPAFAITFGEPDGNGHPFVGSIVVEVPDQGLFQWCSGTLIAMDVFLTASHCTQPLDGILAQFPGSRVLVTFDPVISESATYYTGTWHTHPAYTGFQGQGGHSDPHDIAVILLDEAPGITPAALPTAGLLDTLKANHTLSGTRFTAVGYGTVRTTFQGGFDAILDNLDRNRADQSFSALTPAWLKLSMNPNTGSGGTCYGDSGGPHFIHLNGQETTIVASITVTGDAPCKASDVTYRTDTASARVFLANFVSLP